MLVGPFCGKPACQFIDLNPRGHHPSVCAEAYLTRRTVLVPNVHEHDGHIACDADTNSEIVCPLILKKADGTEVVIGVFDLDCLALSGFNEDDREGLERIVDLVVESCDW